MLKDKYGDIVDDKWRSMELFWKRFCETLVYVCVPSYNNHIGVGQFQAIAFGALTISPYLPERLAYNVQLIPGEHYIMCKDDYSDLIDKIEWCRENKMECKKIGNNAKNYFVDILQEISCIFG